MKIEIAALSRVYGCSCLCLALPVTIDIELFDIYTYFALAVPLPRSCCKANCSLVTTFILTLLCHLLCSCLAARKLHGGVLFARGKEFCNVTMTPGVHCLSIFILSSVQIQIRGKSTVRWKQEHCANTFPGESINVLEARTDQGMITARQKQSNRKPGFSRAKYIQINIIKNITLIL